MGYMYSFIKEGENRLHVANLEKNKQKKSQVKARTRKMALVVLAKGPQGDNFKNLRTPPGPT